MSSSSSSPTLQSALSSDIPSVSTESASGTESTPPGQRAAPGGNMTGGGTNDGHPKTSGSPRLTSPCPCVKWVPLPPRAPAAPPTPFQPGPRTLFGGGCARGCRTCDPGPCRPPVAPRQVLSVRVVVDVPRRRAMATAEDIVWEGHLTKKVSSRAGWRIPPRGSSAHRHSRFGVCPPPPSPPGLLLPRPHLVEAAVLCVTPQWLAVLLRLSGGRQPGPGAQGAIPGCTGSVGILPRAACVPSPPCSPYPLYSYSMCVRWCL